MGGKQESWPSMLLGEENPNWLGAMQKSRPELLQGGISVSVHMFACKDESLKFLSF